MYVHVAAVLGCDLVIYNDLEDIVEAVRSCNPGSLLVIIHLTCPALSYPAQPYPVLSYPTLPCAVLPCSFLLNQAKSTLITISTPFSRTQQTTQHDAI